MHAYLDVLSRVDLFHGIAPAELTSVLDCLQVQITSYKKGALLLTAGDHLENIGIVLVGQLHIVKEDVDGNRTLLAALIESEIFAEVFCCAEVQESPVTVVADTDVTVMLLQFTRILQTCSVSCKYHQKLITNMLRVIARKNLHLQHRMELIRIKSVRTKVLGYLNTFMEKRGNGFTIPLNREEMADYLCVDRSALSHELMRMKRDGLIEYHKNRFTIL